MKIDLTQFSQIFQQNIAKGEQSFQQNLSIKTWNSEICTNEYFNFLKITCILNIKFFQPNKI